MPAIEVASGDWVLSLDGNVLEVFLRGTGVRIHIGYLAIEGKPKKDGLEVIFSRAIGGDMLGREISVRVPPERQAEVDALFAEIKSRKAALPPT